MCLQYAATTASEMATIFFPAAISSVMCRVMASGVPLSMTSMKASVSSGDMAVRLRRLRVYRSPLKRAPSTWVERSNRG